MNQDNILYTIEVSENEITRLEKINKKPSTRHSEIIGNRAKIEVLKSIIENKNNELEGE